MTDYERDQKWVRDSCNGALVLDNGRYVLAPEQLRRFAALAFAAGSRSGEDARDAARYRWLRDQDWFSGPLAVVRSPKEAVSLGHDCPSRDRLDAYIDAAMGGPDA